MVLRAGLATERRDLALGLGPYQSTRSRPRGHVGSGKARTEAEGQSSSSRIGDEDHPPGGTEPPIARWP